MTATHKRQIFASENEPLWITSNPIPGEPEVTKAEAETIEALANDKLLGINEGKWAEITRKDKRDVLRLGQYVGLISTPTVDIQIKPKVEGARNTDENEVDLDKLLELSGNLPSPSSASGFRNPKPNSALLTGWANQFFKRVQQEVNYGLRQDYVEKSDEITSLKGRFDTSRFSATYLQRPHLVPCSYDEYSFDTRLNKIIKQAVFVLTGALKDDKDAMRQRAVGLDLLDQMSNITDTSYRYEDIKWQQLSGLESRYVDILQWAKLIIGGHRTFTRPRNDSSGSSHPGLTMVWDMASVFETAIAKLVGEPNQGNQRVVLQGIKATAEDGTGHSQENLHAAHVTETGYKREHKGSGLLKPDILVTRNGKTALVIDTKWKTYEDAVRTKDPYDAEDYMPVKGLNRNDIYQMLAYATAKRRNKDDNMPTVVLLYPTVTKSADGKPPKPVTLKFTNTDCELIVAGCDVTREGLAGFSLESILGEDKYAKIFKS